MNERLLARLLFGFGLLTVGLMNAFGFHWSTSTPLMRVGFVVAMSATVVGLALDVKHRRADKRLRAGLDGGVA